MTRIEEFFADGIGEITLSGGMVRMDLVSLTGKKGDDSDQPRLEPTRRIIMPPDGFLRSFGAMENLVKQLVDAGLVKPRAAGGANNAGNMAPANGDSEQNSPNF